MCQYHKWNRTNTRCARSASTVKPCQPRKGISLYGYFRIVLNDWLIINRPGVNTARVGIRNGSGHATVIENQTGIRIGTARWSGLAIDSGTESEAQAELKSKPQAKLKSGSMLLRLLSTHSSGTSAYYLISN
ncbi:hypothetical protein EVAR_59965_1 [Eumeta japonica]|uniref:Uncharacterized protein n=1 Tax=Eumeta variegata TaxID=151549 RepID=A0A4C1YSD4_EUMVA|nr:hypothetical protein EVAR_59965_1 [Eumeta japonica]